MPQAPAGTNLAFLLTRGVQRAAMGAWRGKAAARRLRALWAHVPFDVTISERWPEFGTHITHINEGWARSTSAYSEHTKHT